jgi:DNA-binding transcriptional MocR family regulator
MFSQLAVKTYLQTQDWRGQVLRFRDLYRERRDATLEALSDFLPRATWTHPEGGFYVWVTLPEGVDATAMLPRAVTERVAYVPGTAFYADGQGRNHLRISYCYPTPERILEGVRRLAAVVEAELEMNDLFAPDATATPSSGLHAPGPDLS